MSRLKLVHPVVLHGWSVAYHRPAVHFLPRRTPRECHDASRRQAAAGRRVSIG